MSRDAILSQMRAALGARADDPARASAVSARLGGAREGHTVPARASGLSPAERTAAFVRMAVLHGATVAHVEQAADVPAAVADYLAGGNLPAQVRLAPNAWLEGLPWSERPMLDVSAGRARAEDPAGITPCFAAIAETGTLMLLSGPDSPTALNFLPETHIVVLRADQIVGPYEEALARLRARGANFMPRTVNFITGPSRTADIEQTMYMGAHGPKRLHIVLVQEADGPA